MTISWVIGSSGLLGSALVRQLRSAGVEVFTHAEGFQWRSPGQLRHQFEQAMRDFGARARSSERWEIYWAAGIGTMLSTADDMEREAEIISRFLHTLGGNRDLTIVPGVLAFASSAGAIYAGSTDYVVSEGSAPAPTTRYACAKLEQERMFAHVAGALGHCAILNARLSTLYGPGQAYGKRQGLIAHIARCVITNDPIHIYVPFDTIRDYITADDAAQSVTGGVWQLHGSRGAALRIVASERPTTIAQILAAFKKLARRPPRIVTSASPVAASYSRRIQFRSIHSSPDERSRRRNLMVGIADLLATERTVYASRRRAWGVP